MIKDLVPSAPSRWLPSGEPAPVLARASDRRPFGEFDLEGFSDAIDVLGVVCADGESA